MKFEPLLKSHNRKEFDCGQKQVNDFIRNRARQNQDSNAIRTQVYSPDGDGVIWAFYSVQPATISPNAMSNPKKWPPVELGCYRLVWLGVNKPAQGRGLGEESLVVALRHLYASVVKTGGVGVILDAIDENAAAWYRSLDYMTPLTSEEADFFVSVASLQNL